MWRCSDGSTKWESQLTGYRPDDIIFLAQHYWLYRRTSGNGEEGRGLLVPE